MKDINKNYPICDTDIWVKNAKHKEFYLKDLIFNKYEKIYMCDAVRQEIGRKRNDERKRDFELAKKEYDICNAGKCINMLKLNDKSIFDEEKRLAIERELSNYRIVYDDKEGRYKSRTSDLGETVTVVVASMLGIPIVLCDESKASSIIWKYKYLDVRNIVDLLKMHHGNDEEYLQQIRRRLSTPIDNNPEKFSRIKEDNKGRSRLLKFKNKYVS
ncbi:hypothetical protein [Clostridium baratii]|uniref:hypothetical protein n=1 Tax=Clostridium baratii TaxID=1561 RepID=UPI003D32615F